MVLFSLVKKLKIIREDAVIHMYRREKIIDSKNLFRVLYLTKRHGMLKIKRKPKKNVKSF